MPRPEKQGLDYFPLDVNCDDKIELIEAKHGISGFGIVIKLFQRIYKNSYYLNVTEEFILIFSKSINVDINEVNEVIKDCVKYGIFSDEHYSKDILTSNGIQRRYLMACNRRKSITLDRNIFYADINGVNVDINWINTDIGTQRKLKEIKLKEIKVNDTQQNDFIFLTEHIFVTEKKYLSLLSKYGYDAIDNAAIYAEANPDKYKKTRKENNDALINSLITTSIRRGFTIAKPEDVRTIITPEDYAIRYDIDYVNEERGYTTTVEEVKEVMAMFDDIRKYIILSRDDERLRTEITKRAQNRKREQHANG